MSARSTRPLLAALVLLTAVPAAHAVEPDPLTATAVPDALGTNALLELRSRPAGIDVLLQPGTGGPDRVTLQLVSSRGRRSDETEILLPPAGTPARMILHRPSGKDADADLRLLVTREGPHTRAWITPVARYLIAPRVFLLGDSSVYAGTTYAPRVLVRGYAGAEVTASLLPKGSDKPIAETHARADDAGSVSLGLAVPPAAEGEHVLRIAVNHPDGSVTNQFTVQVIHGARVLLSTDKPIYQPGQRVYVRLLARERGNGKASGSAAATVAIFDAKNNKIFQQRGKTSPEGVFAATLDIATMVNTGRWRIEAQVGTSKVERTVDVKPYVLPKFKVELGAERGAYRPGETVRGTVSGRYFFGEPLKDAAVTLTAETFDVAPRELAKMTFKLDATGTHPYELALPDVLTGQPLLQGAASVRLTAHVVDTAGQSYDGDKVLTIYQDALRIVALPEAGRLVPGVDNAVFFVVTTPDGAPAHDAALAVERVGQATVTLKTDARGIAEWHLVPGDASESVTATAKTPDGATTRQTLALGNAGPGAVHVLLRPTDPAPQAGTQLGFDVFVQGAVPYVFVDLIKDGQTLVTLSGPVANGRAHIETALPPEAEGTVLAHAYAIGTDMDVYADTRPMVVRPADDLTIKVTPNQSQWKPGDEASLDIAVTDRAGHPVLAALGLWIVDEAVFALSELRPGMEQVFFLLEQDIMAPKVEIHGFEPDEVFFFEGPRTPRPEAARVLAAAAMSDFKHAVSIDSGVAEKVKSQQFWAQQFTEKANGLKGSVKRWVREHWRMPHGRELHNLLANAGVKPDATRDPFGMPYRVSVARDDNEVGDPVLMSAGLDATWGTSDDLSASLGVDEAMQPVWDWQARREEARWRGRPRIMGDMMMMKGLGDGGGGWADGAGAFGGAAPPPQVMPAVASNLKSAEPPRDRADTTRETAAPNQAAAPTRVRTYFPETLYVNPLVITDAAGHAKVTFPMADSITTWRMSTLASTADGRMGSGTQGLKVFQDFFVDIAFPLSLTRNDEVTVPVAVYNYLSEKQTVKLDFQVEGALTVRGEKSVAGSPATALTGQAGPSRTSVEVVLGPGEVKGVSVALFAGQVGMGRLTVMAKGSKLSDAVRREVKVEPDGFAIPATTSGTLEGQVDLALDIPEGAIANASTLQVKLYPGAFAQVVDGLENMLQMPGGCFEQTSSTTFPNILVLKYLRDAKKTKPELEAKALTYLQAGWQRLVTFEVPGGGFSWFGQAPANRVLTAYGVMEFHDMDKVFGIDKNVLARTRQWLMSQQQADGSWKPDDAFLHQESWGDMQKSSFLVSAYITWALVYTRPGADGSSNVEAPLKKALRYLTDHAAEADDAYALSYLGNALAEAGSDRGALSSALDRLAAKAVHEGGDGGGKIHFTTKQRTATYGSGETAEIEVTALALRAFMRAQQHLDLLKPGLAWLVSKKDPAGNWQSTQATIQVLQALVASLSTQQEPTTGTIDVVLNGANIGTASYTPDDFDVVRFIDGSKALKTGANKLSLIPSKGLRAMFAATATSYLPWTDQRRPAQQAFDVSIAYDRTDLAKDDIVKVKVTVRSNLPGKAEMGIVDVAVPPGFEVLPDDLEAAVARQTLQRFSLAGRQIILYVPEFSPQKPFELEFRVRARFPVKVSTGASRAYEYYNPQNAGSATPGTLVVH